MCSGGFREPFRAFCAGFCVGNVLFPCLMSFLWAFCGVMFYGVVSFAYLCNRLSRGAGSRRSAIVYSNLKTIK